MRKTGILIASCLFAVNAKGIELAMDKALLAIAENKAREISRSIEEVPFPEMTSDIKLVRCGYSVLPAESLTPDQKAERQFGYTSKNLATFYFATERRSYTPIFDLTRSAVRKSQWRTLSGMLN